MSLYNFNVSYVSSVKYAALSAWQASHAYTAGTLVRRTTASISSGNVFVAYQAGTSSGTEPTWPGNRGQEVTDNTVKWIEVTGQPAFNGDSANTARWSTVQNKAVDTGNVIQDASGNVFVVTTSGTTNNTGEPTWNTTAGSTTTDNTATWTCVGTISGFGAWKAPHPSVQGPNKGNWAGGGAGNNPKLTQIYVAHDHAESQSGGLSFAPGNSSSWAPLDMICVSSAGSVPPVTADLATTATVTAASNSIDIGTGYFRLVYGIAFIATGTSNFTINLCDGNSDILYRSCSFQLQTTGSGARFSLSSGGTARCEDCTFTFANAGQGFNGLASWEIVGGSIGATGSVPTDLFVSVSAGSRALLQGVDLSALTSTTLVGGNSAAATSYQFIDCKMPSAYTVCQHSGDQGRNAVVSLVRCSASGNTDQFQFSDTTQDSSFDGSVVRTGGASGVAAFSVKQVTRTACDGGSKAAVAPPMVVPNLTTGSDVVVTLYGIVNSATLPTKLEAHVEAFYMGTASNTVASRKSSRPDDVLNSTTIGNCSSDTSAWDTAATPRANSHAYSVGDVYAAASNSGRVFFCTTAGTSASSEPGGVASAIDGGSVTDGTAVFRAGVRFSVQVTLTSPQPQVAGNITVYFRAGRASATYYLDPLPVLT